MQVDISSRRHPLVGLCRALHDGKGRREHKLFLVEGENAVGAALEARWPLREVLTSSAQDELSIRARDLGVPVRVVTRAVMEAACETVTPPSILALGTMTERFSWPEEGLILVIDGVGDPGNVGTLLRAADAMGASGTVLIAGGADPWSPKVVRSAAGSLFALPPLVAASPEELAKELSSRGFTMVSAQAHEGVQCWDFEWPARTALIIGHETRGPSPVWGELAKSITIPQWGRAESLNAAMAGALLLYEWRRSHRQNATA